MAKIADVRAASTISSPTLSRFLVFLFLLFLRTLGPARLFLFLLNYKATLSDSFFLPLVFFAWAARQKKSWAELMSSSIVMGGLLAHSFVFPYIFICALEQLVVRLTRLGMYISQGFGHLGQLFFFLGMVGWFWKAQDRDGVGERGYCVMEK